MGKFIAIISQESEGCDYTVGCGTKVVDIEAKDKQAAFQKLLKGSLFCDVNSGDAEPDSVEEYSVRLIEVAEDDKKIFANWLASMTSKAADIREENKKKSDEAEFERLKKKLGK